MSVSDASRPEELFALVEADELDVPVGMEEELFLTAKLPSVLILLQPIKQRQTSKDVAIAACGGFLNIDN